MVKMKSVEPDARAAEMWRRLRQVIIDEIMAGEIGTRLSDTAILALVSQLLGLVLAMQDQRAHTTDDYMTMVIQNIEIGNKTFIDTVFAELKDRQAKD